MSKGRGNSSRGGWLVLLWTGLLLAICGAQASDAGTADANQPDSMQCFACVTMMTALQLDVKKEGPHVMYRRLVHACPNVPSHYRPMCDKLTGFLKKLGGETALGFIGMVPADVACSQLIPMCNQCHLDPNAANSPMGPLVAMFAGGLRNLRGVLLPSGGAMMASPDGSNMAGSADIPTNGDAVPTNCGPFIEGGCAETVDNDGDLFSPSEKSARGSDWRGRDCNDADKAVYPGVGVETSESDSNCNGVHGKTTDGALAEDKFCKGTGSVGVVNFGDSLSAGFHIHGKWLRLDDMQELRGSFRQELDVPQMSWVTGFSKGSTSIYSSLRDRNLCNHRDYQNLAFNGAKMEHFPSQVASMARTPKDKPILGFVAYVGNDVCGKHGAMTEAAAFRHSLETGLSDLDKKVAHGSRVVLVGITDGSFLSQTMSEEMHPIGVPYPQLYDFMTCTQVNPCPNWLTSDPSLISAAQARAAELNKILADVAAKSKAYENFEVVYVDFPLEDALNDAEESLGLAPVELINPVDGFHPQLAGDSLLAKKMLENLQKVAPSFIGADNPHNKEILEAFGEQGGH